MTSFGGGKICVHDHVELVDLDEATESPKDARSAFLAFVLIFLAIFAYCFLQSAPLSSQKEAPRHERTSR